MKIVYFLALILVFAGIAVAAHFMVGEAVQAADGTDPDGYTVLIYRAGNVSDNVTDIIGVGGNSGTDNLFMGDCELFITPCDIGNNITAQIQNNGSGYASDPVNATVTGAGFDVFPNLTLKKVNIAPNITNVNIENNAASLNLLPGITRAVICNATIFDDNGAIDVRNITAMLYDSLVAGPISADDNNNHYTNMSCINITATQKEMNATCTFNIWYYANNNTNNWICNVTATDSFNEKGYGFDTVGVNELVALNVPSLVDYGPYSPLSLTNESNITVSNFGNVAIDISLYGYATFDSDNNSFNCTNRMNISINDERYNFTSANTSFYTEKKNLTNVAATEFSFDLAQRTDDLVNTANKSMYWQVFVPDGVDGNCTGTIVFTALVGG